jgi:lipoyl(octanoyl) transferase
VQPIIACHLGRIGYAEAWELQKQLQARLIAAKRSEPPVAIPHVLLLVEHPHVFTLGKNGSAANLLLSEAELQEQNASFFHIDRGGDITYHGPGQLVGYPILDLDRFFTDIHRYLRELEESIIRTCAEYGLQAKRIAGRTGVWIGPDDTGDERKIAALGIRCSRWVTMHGFAFNINPDLRYFSYIIPCGISDRGVTSLAAESGDAPDLREVAARLLSHFADLFGADLVRLEGEQAYAFIQAYLTGNQAAKNTLDVPPDRVHSIPLLS